jgi:Phycobilisome protein
MLTLLENLVEGAEGSYVSAEDFRSFEHAMSSWSVRKEAYEAVQAKEQAIIDRAISLMCNDPARPENKSLSATVLELGRRDMTLALRYYSLGMLLQDEAMLKDRFIYWQKNIIRSMDLHQYQGVKFVFEAICVELPKEQSNLLRPYFKVGQDMIMSN